MPYALEPTQGLGYFYTTIELRTRFIDTKVCVIVTDISSILGITLCIYLRSVNFIHKNMNKNVNTIIVVKKNIIKPVLHEMQDKSTAIFEGVSKVKDYQATMAIEKIQWKSKIMFTCQNN